MEDRIEICSSECTLKISSSVASLDYTHTHSYTGLLTQGYTRITYTGLQQDYLHRVTQQLHRVTQYTGITPEYLHGVTQGIHRDRTGITQEYLHRATQDYLQRQRGFLYTGLLTQGYTRNTNRGGGSGTK